MEFFDAIAGNELTVVELELNEARTPVQLLKCHVGDERTIVELEHLQCLVHTRAVGDAELSDAFVRDALTTRQCLE